MIEKIKFIEPPEMITPSEGGTHNIDHKNTPMKYNTEQPTQSLLRYQYTILGKELKHPRPKPYQNMLSNGLIGKYPAT